MNLNKIFLKYLQEHDYEFKETSFGIEFSYQNLSFQYFSDDNDDQFFQLVLPSIYDVDENNYSLVTEATDKTNAEIKVIKTYVYEGKWVNVAFEILTDYTPDLADFLPRAISLLLQARLTFYKSLENLK
ncbi:MAG: hypothetical protein J6I72_08340 [Muribaculaceae bacterium]|nr:hypothetical protein [Muribaculaceae bacterium]